MRRVAMLVAGLALLSAGASAQTQDKPEKKSTADQAGDIASQPVRDVGVMKTKIPPVLQEAAEAPYSLEGLRNCRAIRAAVGDLNKVLGADFAGGPASKNRKVKITGDTVAGLIVPFRGIVREVSGAAAAQRRLDAATDAGIARRGFLRGVYETRRCRPAL